MSVVPGDQLTRAHFWPAVKAAKASAARFAARFDGRMQVESYRSIPRRSSHAAARKLEVTLGEQPGRTRGIFSKVAAGPPLRRMAAAPILTAKPRDASLVPRDEPQLRGVGWQWFASTILVVAEGRGGFELRGLLPRKELRGRVCGIETEDRQVDGDLEQGAARDRTRLKIGRLAPRPWRTRSRCSWTR